MLYLLAGVVAFAAVLGAWYLGQPLSPRKSRRQEERATSRPSQLTAPGQETPVAALLVVQDAGGRRSRRVRGPARPAARGAERRVRLRGRRDGRPARSPRTSAAWSTRRSTPSTRVPVSDAGATGRHRRSCRSRSSVRGGRRRRRTTQMVKDGDSRRRRPTCRRSSSDAGADRRDMTAPAGRRWSRPLLEAAALRPAGERRGPRRRAARRRTAATPGLSDASSRRSPAAPPSWSSSPPLPGSPRGSSPSCRTPRRSWPASPGRRPPITPTYTVQVRNGSGKIGVGEAVVERLASLDVNLPDAAQRRQLRLPADADPRGPGDPPGGPRHPCYTRPRRRPRRPRPADGHRRRHRRRRLQGIATQHKGPAVAARPRTHDLRTPGARHRRASPPTRRRRTSSSSAWTRPCRTPTYFVIVTGANTRQTKAIADEIQHRLRADRRPARVEGEREGEWILVDFIDVVVHVFTHDGPRLLPARDAVGRRSPARRAGGGVSVRTRRMGPEMPRADGEVHHEAQTHGRGADRAVHDCWSPRRGPGAGFRPRRPTRPRCCELVNHARAGHGLHAVRIVDPLDQRGARALPGHDARMTTSRTLRRERRELRHAGPRRRLLPSAAALSGRSAR